MTGEIYLGSHGTAGGGKNGKTKRLTKRGLYCIIQNVRLYSICKKALVIVFMDDDGWLSLVIILILLVIGAYFASSEIALSSVNKIRIRLLADKGDKGAKNVQYILDNFDKALSTILIGNNLSHILASSIATVMAARMWGTNSVAATTLVLTVVVFFFAELLPKNIAKKYSEHFSQTIAGSLIFLMKICSPFSSLLTKISNGAASLFGGKSSGVTEDEFHDMVENIAEEGSLEAQKGELVQSALNFGEHTVDDILTVRVDVVAVEVTDTVNEVLDKLGSVRHSRLPVYQDSIDNVVGILSCRRFIKAYLKFGEKTDIRQIMDPPIFVHGSTDIADLLPVMNRRKASMAIVTDDYGGMEGIVTVEDILEELVGDIWDEDDEVVESFVKVDENTFDVDASMNIDDCLDRMGYEDYDEDEVAHKNMVSLVYDAFDAIPAEGDSFLFNNDLKITVLKMEKRRILTLRIKREGAGEK